ncbi:hypothetical protein F4818DRAFT_442528 [Hypoxylon cercidicola]|nr:hypothetical protein F4818DRAFT_442528 [Hypoxylon cercidicola]
MHTAATIGVILVPVGLIAVMLAVWYCPFRHRATPAPGVEAGNTSTERPDILLHPDIIARPDMAAHPYTAPPLELDAHQSSRLSRISEEGGPNHHHYHHHHFHFGAHK